MLQRGRARPCAGRRPAPAGAIAALVVLAAALPAIAQSGFSGEAAERELAALEAAVEAAFQRADVSYLDAVLAPDFQFWTAAGKPIGKERVLETYGQAGRFPRREQTSVAVEVHGDVALSNGRLEVRSTVPREYVVCYLRLYEKRDGRWRLVSHRTFRERDGLEETCAPMDR